MTSEEVGPLTHKICCHHLLVLLVHHLHLLHVLHLLGRAVAFHILPSARVTHYDVVHEPSQRVLVQASLLLVRLDAACHYFAKHALHLF